MRAWLLRPVVFDVLIAVVVFIVSVQPLLQPQGCGCPPVRWWGYGLVLTQCLPLVWRRRFPVWTAVLIGIALAVQGEVALPEPVLPFAGLVALYTVAAHARRKQAVLAAVLTAVVLLVILVVDPAADAQDYTVLYLIFATAWLLGDSARSRRERALQLEESAAQLRLTRNAEAQRVVVEERNRIAREMHDVVAHHVSLMVVQAEAGPVVLPGAPDKAVEVFDSISATGKQALAQMRQLLGVLRTEDAAGRAPQPGVHGLDELAAAVREAGLPVELVVTGSGLPLPAGVDLSAYRIVQEALTNCLRHAGPARAWVSLDYGGQTLRLSVIDDGVGADGVGADGVGVDGVGADGVGANGVGADGVGANGHTPAAGNGLVGMGERARLLGGRVHAGPRPDGGWEVRAELPLPERSQ